MVITRNRIILTVAFLAGIAAVFIADHVHVSPEERIKATIDDIKDALETGNPEGVMEHISDTFSAQGLTADDIRMIAKQFCGAADTISIRVRRTEVHISGDFASATVSVISRSENGRFYGPSSWALDLAREGEVWRVTRITPLAIGQRPVTDWDNLLQSYFF